MESDGNSADDGYSAANFEDEVKDASKESLDVKNKFMRKSTSKTSSAYAQLVVEDEPQVLKGIDEEEIQIYEIADKEKLS